MSCPRFLPRAALAAAALLAPPWAAPRSGPRAATAWDTAPPIAFVEVSVPAGIRRQGPTYGASVGDLDGNGWPDLYVSSHGAAPTLYLNAGGGVFLDVAALVLQSDPSGDTHGAAWADWDGDGDEDLLQLVGASRGAGKGPNQAWRQGGGVLTDVAAEMDLEVTLGRGRTPLWLDWDGDGRLDVVTTHFARADGLAPSTLLLQEDRLPRRAAGPTVFREPWPRRGLGLTGSHSFAQLGDLSGDGHLDLVVHGFPHPAAVFQVGSYPPRDVLPQLGLPGTGNVMDAVLADLDGDLQCDLFVTTSDPESQVVLADPRTLEAGFLVSGNEEGVQVEVGGTTAFLFGPPWFVPASRIFLGASGLQPPSTAFVLDPTDPNVQGVAPHTPGKDDGVYVGYDPVLGRWDVLVSWSSWNRVDLVMLTGPAIRAVTPVGYDPSAAPPADRLLLRRGRTFLDATMGAGLGVGSESGSVTCGDFDNDGDLDLYLVRTGSVTNLPNLLWSNDGAGRFTEVPQAGGAPGSADGRGDVVVSADVDGDGFLDLFLVNGQGDPLFSQDGPHQLYRNVGNQNHWLMIDLVGTRSNVHGIGARVLVTAGDRTWLREQGGGMHRYAQDHRRVHFGLGAHARVDRLEVQWPSGLVQVLEDLRADQVLTVTEPVVGPGRSR